METKLRSFCDVPLSHTDLQSESVPYEWVEGGHCVVCRKPFEGLHLLSQKTCSPTCRKRLQRLRVAEDQVANRVIRELQTIRRGIKRNENVTKRIEELNRIKEEINDLLHLAGDDEELTKREMFNSLKAKRV